MKAHAQESRPPILGVDRMSAIGAGSASGKGKADVFCALPAASIMRIVTKLGRESIDIDGHDSARDAILIEVPSSKR